MTFYEEWCRRCFPALNAQQLAGFGSKNTEAELLAFEAWLNTRVERYTKA